LGNVLVQGGEGGPEVLKLADGTLTVVGINSHRALPPGFRPCIDGDPCDPRYLQVAVNVAYHLKWIEANLDVDPRPTTTRTPTTTNSKQSLLLRAGSFLSFLFG
jgi:hypothetical protein